MHLTSIPLAPFDNLRTFSSIEAGDLYVTRSEAPRNGREMLRH